MKKSNLPAEVRDSFQKANILHGYVEKSLGEATQHALDTGLELQAAKKAIPHGRWESECKRLFDGSARTARFYMEFARHISSLPKRQASAVLLVEGTLEGAAKVARKAAKEAAKPKVIEGKVIGRDHSPPADPFDEANSQHDTGEEVEEDTKSQEEAPSPPRNGTEAAGGDGGGSGAETPQNGSGKPPRQVEKSAWLIQWHKQIAGTVRMVDSIAGNIDELHCFHQKTVQKHLEAATQEMIKWLED